MDVPEPVWIIQKMPATTQFDNSMKVDKLVGYLPVEEAIKL